MKNLALCCSLFLLSQSFITRSYGQDSIIRSQVDTFIRSKPGYVLKKGFYKNYQEFLNNAPSVEREFTITPRKKSEKDRQRGICVVELNLVSHQGKKGSIWGFCDGNAVYYKFSPFESKYWKLIYVGPHSFLFHVTQIRTPNDLLNAAFEDPAQLYFFNKKGHCKIASENNLRKLFSKEHDIANAYINNSNSASEYTRELYLRKYNELIGSKKIID